MSRRRRSATIALSLAAAGAVGLIAPARAATDDLALISRATGPAGAPVDSSVFDSSSSASGERVAFSTAADNISADDDNAFNNVFVREAALDLTTFVSRATGPAGAGGDDVSSNPSISGNGRVVAFESRADNLSADDDDAGIANIFARDLVAGTTTLVSRASGPGGAGADASAVDPDISDDGRFVVFESAAENLSADDDDAFVDIFVRDLVADTTSLVSRRPGRRGAAANGDSSTATISGDGDRIAFSSQADNLSNEDDNGVGNVFVRDRSAGVVALVSRATGAAGAAAGSAAIDPDMSRSGRFVTFASGANNLSAADDDLVTNIFLRDLDESTTELISRASGPGGAAAGGTSFVPVVSDNARVAFHSHADELSTADNDAFTNVFVRDALSDTTTLVSRRRGAAGAAANDDSFEASTSADGRYVTFGSTARNLVGGTIDGRINVFRREMCSTTRSSQPRCRRPPPTR